MIPIESYVNARDNHAADNDNLQKIHMIVAKTN
jgi:hypothetical protein